MGPTWGLPHLLSSVPSPFLSQARPPKRTLCAVSFRKTALLLYICWQLGNEVNTQVRRVAVVVGMM